MGTARVAGPGPVRRLLVRFGPRGPKVVGDVRVAEMTIPRSVDLPLVEAGRTASGFWWELRDAEGGVLYRQSVAQPLRHSHEQFEVDGSIRRVDPAERGGRHGAEHEVELEILVPDLPEAAEVSFVSDEGLRGERRAAAESIGSVRVPKKAGGTRRRG
jgi:hypothetical protein